MSGRSKEEARRFVWRRLKERGQGAFPYPLEDRIPNFKGSRQAAERLAHHPWFQEADTIKVNPDAPQAPVRQAVLDQGKVLYMPTPRLRRGFMRLDPQRIAAEERRRAVTVSHHRRYADEVPLRRLEPIDLFVSGSVAVTRSGRRAGKGHGYSDLEYAMLAELGQTGVPTATTVHPLQVLPELPVEEHDLQLQLICTPKATIETGAPPAEGGVDWQALPPEALEKMPVLAELREMDGG